MKRRLADMLSISARIHPLLAHMSSAEDCEDAGEFVKEAIKLWDEYASETDYEKGETQLYVWLSRPPGPESDFVEVDNANGEGVHVPIVEEEGLWRLGPFSPAVRLEVKG